MRRINVLHLLSLSDLGGAERMVLTLCKSLDRRDFDAGIVCLYGGGRLEAEARLHGVPFFTLPSPLPMALMRLVRLLRAQRIDILQSHGARTEVLAAWAGRFAGVKVVSTLHDLYGFGSPAKAVANRLANPCISRYVSVTWRGRDLAQQKFGIDGRRIEVIENGIEQPVRVPQIKIKELKRSFGIRSELLVVTIANLRPVKGHIHILRALQSMASVERQKFIFCFVGADQMNGALQRMAAEMNLGDRIVFAGFQADISLYLYSADIFFLASEDEGMPLALLEAMAAGCPVVACNVGGIPEAIKNGHNGLLIPPKSPEAIQAALFQLAQHSELRRTLGAEAEKTVIARYSAENMVNKYADLYRRLMRLADGGK